MLFKSNQTFLQASIETVNNGNSSEVVPPPQQVPMQK